MDIWFTGDTHFGHANIIKYCNRPFKDVDEMDNTLIENWNRIVKPNDLVYHLGDFLFKGKKANELLSVLNGEVVLIVGNHDSRLSKQALAKFKAVHNTLLLEKQDIILSHKSLSFWKELYSAKYNVHGHSHGTSMIIKNRLDVGCDCFNFCPVHLDVVMEILKNR